MIFLHGPQNINKTRLWVSLRIALMLSSLSLFGCSTLSQMTQKLGPTKILPPTQPIDNLGNLVQELKKTMPKANSEGFIVPSQSDQQAFQDMANAIENNNPDLAIKMAPTYNYELLILPDQKDFEAKSFVLSERMPIKIGWGLYLFRKDSPQNVVIEAPHPSTDEYTEEVALDLYRALQAKALLISGTYRNANADGSADSAHASKSIFQTMHITLFNLAGHPNNNTIFLQIHGYATQGHQGYPQVVISFNWKNDPERDLLITKIAQAMQSNDITIGICNGKNYRDICGTTNIQRAATNGGIFIHLELDESLREHDNPLINALQQAIRSSILPQSYP